VHLFSFSKNIMIKKFGLLAVSALIIATPFIASADAINRQLEVGMSGSDVSAMQTFFASDVTIYPQGLITGYFGFLTKAAVSNFQSRNGLPAVGRVGPMTLPVLNLQMANGGHTTSGADVNSAIITNVSISAGRTAATVGWTTSENAKGSVYYSTSPLSTYENLNSVNIGGSVAATDTNLHTSQNVSLQGLTPSTMYYYMVSTTDQAGNISVTWPSTFQTSN
jgi:peptidoglycan hydrolase-like protein with peptidoglycan-binding domain